MSPLEALRRALEAAVASDLRPQADAMRLRAVIVRFPTFARDTRPGHVNGMRPEHVPTRDSWHADALALYMRLRQLAGFDEQCEQRSLLWRANKRRIGSSESL